MFEKTFTRMSLKQPEYQNSAGRLLVLLTAIPKNSSILENAYKLYDQASSSSRMQQQAAIRFLLDVHKLYLEFKEDMQEASINDQQRDVLLKGLASIEDTLYPTSTKQQFRGVTEAEESLLRVCATFIDQSSPITSEDIEAIRQSIAELRAQIESGDIPPLLKKSLLELVRLSEDSISRFNIEGAKGLRRAFKSMLGEASDIIGRIDSEEERAELQKSSAWAAIVKHLKTFDSVASKLLKYAPFLIGGAKDSFVLQKHLWNRTHLAKIFPLSESTTETTETGFGGS